MNILRLRELYNIVEEMWTFRKLPQDVAYDLLGIIDKDIAYMLLEKDTGEVRDFMLRRLDNMAKKLRGVDNA